MPFLLAEVLNFQGTTHLIGVGSLSKIKITSKTRQCSRYRRVFDRGLTVKQEIIIIDRHIGIWIV